MNALSTLDVELAAYTRGELGQLADTLRILFEVTDDGSIEHVEAQARIMSIFSAALQRHRLSQPPGEHDAEIIPFPGNPAR